MLMAGGNDQLGSMELLHCLSPGAVKVL